MIVERRRRGSEDITLNREIHNNGEFWVSNGVTSEWLASLPPTGRGRERSMTAPPMPSMSLINNSPRKGATLPANATLLMGSDSSVESDDTRTHERYDPANQTLPDKKSSKSDVQKEESVTVPSPLPVETAAVSPTKTPKPRQGLIKLYMDKVQKGELELYVIQVLKFTSYMCVSYAGALYKSFLIDTNTTAEQLTVQALDKASMSDRDPTLYCIWELAAIPNGRDTTTIPY